MLEKKNYYRIMLGRKSIHSEECHNNGFIGADFGLDMDLSGRLPDNWRSFNKEFIPIFLKQKPDKSKVAAGLACGMLHTITKGIQKNDIVLCPDGAGSYLVGEVTGDYHYQHGGILPHRRAVQWYPSKINREEMSQELKYSSGSIGTVCNISKYAFELSKLIGDPEPAKIIATDILIEDPSVFALEKHLEDFLVHNWQNTELGKNYHIYEVDGELVGQQFPTDTGPIDILALSKDKKELLVVELKKGRASDAVIGQVQRYMGYVMEELAEETQVVRGAVIALEDDIRINRALSVAPNIDFYKYKVSFKLYK